MFVFRKPAFRLPKLCVRKTNIIQTPLARNASGKKSKSKNMRVTIVGAGGYIGQPLALMLKQCPLIDEIHLHDVTGISGLGLELSHVDTVSKVRAFSTIDNIKPALEGAKVVIVIAAAAKTAHIPYSAMFEANANIVYDLMKHFATHSPQAMLVIATNPINSIVPLAAEALTAFGVYNPKKIFGVTCLDVIRANTFVAQLLGIDPECVAVPVVGGHSTQTIVPLLSHAQPCADFTCHELESLTKDIQKAHFDVVSAKSQDSSPTLSTAFAIARFVISLLKGMRGDREIIECAYVRSDAHPSVKYLSNPVLLGPEGVKKNLGVPKLSEYENCLLENALPLLQGDIKKGECFVGVTDPRPCDPCDPDPKAPPCPPNWCSKKGYCN